MEERNILHEIQQRALQERLLEQQEIGELYNQYTALRELVWYLDNAYSNVNYNQVKDAVKELKSEQITTLLDRLKQERKKAEKIIYPRTVEEAAYTPEHVSDAQAAANSDYYDSQFLNNPGLLRHRTECYDIITTHLEKVLKETKR
jgi:hypothetical protein